MLGSGCGANNADGGDGGDYWEVFMDDRATTTTTSEHTVSWDYDATLCYRVISPT